MWVMVMMMVMKEGDWLVWNQVEKYYKAAMDIYNNLSPTDDSSIAKIKNNLVREAALSDLQLID